MFSAVSDPVLRWALWTGVAATVFTALIVFIIVALRIALLREERHWQAFVARWRPLLLATLLEPEGSVTLPALPPRERRPFLRLWVYLHESVRGEAADRLNVVARALGIDAYARGRLARGSRAARLQAVLALGRLRDTAAFEPLLRLAELRDPLLSINAARALVQIDPLRAVEALMVPALRREDWDVARMAAFLSEARDAFRLFLLRRLPTLRPHEVPRALRLARALRLELPAASLRRLLSARPEGPAVREALPLMQGPDLHDQVLQALDHADAGVRVEALQALAALAVPADLPRLTARLRDEAARVRLASARALLALPFVEPAQLQALAAEGEPGHAEIRHAIAERDWQEGRA